MMRAALLLTVAIAGCSSAPATVDETGAPSEPATPSPTAASEEPTPSNVLPPGVTLVFELDFLPSGILTDGDLIWAEDHARTNAVYAIDPESGETVASIDVDRPCDLVAAFDRIWVPDLNQGRLVWIDPSTHDIGGEVPGFNRPCGVQADGEALWVAVDDGLARVDGTTLEVTVTSLEGPAFPGSGSPLWAMLIDSGHLVRVGSTGEAELTMPNPGGLSGAFPVTAFGSVWIGASGDTVLRLDPETGELQAEIAATGPTRMLATDQAVWLTNFDRGIVERIDPETNEVVFHAALGGNSNGIAEGFGWIWVADTQRGQLFRIDPQATAPPP